MFSLPTDEATAAPDIFLSCAEEASSARELRGCSTFRDEVNACEVLRGEGTLAPVACLQSKVTVWQNALLREAAIATGDSLRAAADLQAWQSGINDLCRDAEQIELSTERYGEGFAQFEVARCELRATIRQMVETKSVARGFK